MSDPIDKDGERWLDALAGRPDLDTGDPTSVEARAIRKALQARAQRLGAIVPPADGVLLDRLRFRLRRERLTEKKSVFRNPAAWALAASIVLGVGIGVRIGVIEVQPDPSVVDLPRVPPTLTESETARLRPLEFATLVAAADPEARATQLIRGMPMISVTHPPGAAAGARTTPDSWLGRSSWDDAKRSFQALSDLSRDQVQAGVPVVMELGKNQIMLVVQATDAMIEYLRSQDVEPTVTDGEIFLLIHADEPRPVPSIRP